MVEPHIFSLHCPVCSKLTRAEEVIKFAHYRCMTCKNVINVTNVSIREWLGFNYSEYLKSIQKVIANDAFDNLRGKNAADVARGKFSAKQVTKLKDVLDTNFSEGNTIRDIALDIRNKVKVKDLKVYNEDGDLIQIIPKEARSVNIARTETSRVANLGAQDHYGDGGVKLYAWLAAADGNTCPDCLDLNGQVFPIGSDELPPAHSLCRCTITAVVEK